MRQLRQRIRLGTHLCWFRRRTSFSLLVIAGLMADLELLPKLPKLPNTNQCMVRMVPHRPGEPIPIPAIPG